MLYEKFRTYYSSFKNKNLEYWYILLLLFSLSTYYIINLLKCLALEYSLRIVLLAHLFYLR